MKNNKYIRHMPLSQKQYSIIMIFGALALNDDIFRCFFIFLKFSFFGLLGEEKTKK